MESMQQLNQWWQAQCDGDWEHEFGVSIGTLDNPGWIVKIDIMYTHMQDWRFEPVSRRLSETDWHDYRIVPGTTCGGSEFMHFVGMGGPNNLDDILSFFLNAVAMQLESEDGDPKA